MNAQQVVVGIYLALEKAGGKNLVEKTRAAARATGVSFSNAESSRWLKPFIEVNGRKTDGVRTESGRFRGRKTKHETDGSADGKRTENGRETDSRANKESLSSNTPPERVAIVVDEPPSDEPKKKRERKPVDLSVPHVWPSINDPDLPAWVSEVRRSVNAVGAKPLSELTGDERFTLARYHAWRWANCTKDEQRNRKAAGDIASGIANLAFHHIYGGMSVLDYVQAGDEAWNRRGRYPMKSSWQVVGVLELEGST